MCPPHVQVTIRRRGWIADRRHPKFSREMHSWQLEAQFFAFRVTEVKTIFLFTNTGPSLYVTMGMKPL